MAAERRVLGDREQPVRLGPPRAARPAVSRPAGHDAPAGPLLNGRWDVIILGGGPAGTATALNLVRHDPAWARRILIVEKARYPRHKLCGGGISEYGMGALRRLGLDVAEVPHAAVDEVRIVHGRQRLSFWNDPALRIVRRDLFDHWLARQAVAAGVTIREGETVVDVGMDRDGATLRTTAGTHAARVVVGADGSKGISRRKLGIRSTGGVARLIEVLTPAADADPLHEQRLALFDFAPVAQHLQGYYWDFPCLVTARRASVAACTMPARSTTPPGPT